MFSLCKLIPYDINANKQCIQWLSNIPNLQIRKHKTLKVIWLFIMEIFKYNSREKSLMNHITWLQQLSSLCQFCFIFGKSILEQCKSTQCADQEEMMSFMQKKLFLSLTGLLNLFRCKPTSALQKKTQVILMTFLVPHKEQKVIWSLYMVSLGSVI